MFVQPAPLTLEANDLPKLHQHEENDKALSVIGEGPSPFHFTLGNAFLSELLKQVDNYGDIVGQQRHLCHWILLSRLATIGKPFLADYVKSALCTPLSYLYN